MPGCEARLRSAVMSERARRTVPGSVMAHVRPLQRRKETNHALSGRAGVPSRSFFPRPEVRGTIARGGGLASERHRCPASPALGGPAQRFWKANWEA